MSNQKLKKKIFENIKEISKLTSELNSFDNKLVEAKRLIVKGLKNGGSILFCGNGGSAAECNHIAAEFTGKFLKKDRKPLPAISLNSNNSVITAISNDFSYHEVFLRQIKSFNNKNNILIALSTSGKSLNVINAIKQAKKQKFKTILFTGRNKKLDIKTNVVFNINSRRTDRIQEMHLALLHFLCEIVEEDF